MNPALDRPRAGALVPSRPLDTAAAHSLQQQVLPFQQAGLDVAERRDAAVDVTTPALRISIGYRTQKHLLARIHQVQLTTSVPAASGPRGDCALELRIRGARRKGHWWKPSGAAEHRAAEIATTVDGTALADLVRTVDLTACTLTWTERARRWQVRVEPYGGHHLRLLVPPMTYTNTLTCPEVGAITAAMHELAAALAGPGEELT